MSFNVRTIEQYWGKPIEVTFIDGHTLIGIYETFLPWKDNGYNAILLRSETNLYELRNSEIASVKPI